MAVVEVDLVAEDMEKVKEEAESDVVFMKRGRKKKLSLPLLQRARSQRSIFLAKAEG